MKKFYTKLIEELKSGKRVAVCIVVDSSGSVPRGIGAKIALSENGEFWGSVGGGSVEYNAISYCKNLLLNDISRVQKFALNGTDNNFDMVCGGQVELLYYVADHNDIDQFELLVKNKNSWFILELTDNLSTKIHVFDSNDSLNKSMFPEQLFLNTFNYINEERTLYSESNNPPYICRIFGGGHVGKELAYLLTRLNFDVFVYDDREDIAVTDRFIGVKEISLVNYSNLSNIDFDNCFIVVLTHGHKSDYDVLEYALTTKANYIGCIGSKSKAEYIRSKLEKAGFSIEDIKRIYSPIGLNIGAVLPEEIAVSIAAEIIKKRSEL